MSPHIMEHASQKAFHDVWGSIPERQNPKEIKGTRKDVSLRLIFNYKSGKQHSLRMCRL